MIEAQAGDPTQLEPQLDAAIGLASNGYVRSNLYVVPGSASASGGSAGVSAGAAGSQDITVGGEAGASGSVAVPAAVQEAVDDKLSKIREARIKGYEGDACGECGNFTLVRNGTCMKCETCGGTSGCS